MLKFLRRRITEISAHNNLVLGLGESLFPGAVLISNNLVKVQKKRGKQRLQQNHFSSKMKIEMKFGNKHLYKEWVECSVEVLNSLNIETHKR